MIAIISPTCDIHRTLSTKKNSNACSDIPPQSNGDHVPRGSSTCEMSNAQSYVDCCGGPTKTAHPLCGVHWETTDYVKVSYVFNMNKIINRNVTLMEWPFGMIHILCRHANMSLRVFEWTAPSTHEDSEYRRIVALFIWTAHSQYHYLMSYGFMVMRFSKHILSLDRRRSSPSRPASADCTVVWSPNRASNMVS